MALLLWLLSRILIAFQYTAGIYKEFELFNLSSLRAILEIGGKPNGVCFLGKDNCNLKNWPKSLKE